ncbi:MAG TPA: FAD-dependent oxidoreductase [Candidatus Acidoferrales bacterium]
MNAQNAVNNEIIKDTPRPGKGSSSDCEVVIVGTGPYGLSAAAHLKKLGMDVRIFGKPMDFWANKMPAGMLLRSPRVASNISDPGHQYSLEAYESSAAVAPRAPLPLETFVDYGLWFRRQLGSILDEREIKSVSGTNNGFRIELEDGDSFQCQRVVVAAGIGPFQRIPAVFSALSPGQVSHCYQGCEMKSFRGQRVAVIGAGQSALECAALLHESGAEVELLVRNSILRWIGGAPLLHKLGPFSALLYSSHDVGPAGISRLVAYPNVVRHIPLGLRDKIRKRAVRSAGSRWLPARLKDVKVSTSRYVTEAASAGRAVEMKLDDGSRRSADHVLLGTGYSVDIAKYPFLSRDLVAQIDQFDGYPRLSSGLRSSVPGLHFIGATAARSFGPLLYFVAGTEFASNELAGHLARSRAVR